MHRQSINPSAQVLTFGFLLELTVLVQQADLRHGAIFCVVAVVAWRVPPLHFISKQLSGDPVLGQLRQLQIQYMQQSVVLSDNPLPYQFGLTNQPGELCSPLKGNNNLSNLNRTWDHQVGEEKSPEIS